MQMSPTQQPPAQPVYILRGHSSAIHATKFIRQNTRLVTGDADGWVVVWDLVTKRPVAVWRAHEGVILGVAEWPRARRGEDMLISHGKDNLLLVWRLSQSDEEAMSTVLPVDATAETRRKPWLVYALRVNTMNFCAFDYCSDQESSRSGRVDEDGRVKKGEAGILVAVPNILTSETVDVFHLPTSERLYTTPNGPNTKTGMIMAVSIFYHPVSRKLTVVMGYESGYTAVAQLIGEHWKILYLARCHDQPILSLDIDPSSKEWYLTSSADATIAKHPIPDFHAPAPEILSPIVKSPEAPPTTAVPASTTTSTTKPSLLSLAFASSTAKPPQPNVAPQTQAQERSVQAAPLKINKTKHSGQQGLRIRSDAKIFATAGWDGKLRVYSTKTLKEIAVLKWHGVGCFALDFADVNVEDSDQETIEVEANLKEGDMRKLSTSRDVTRDIKLERSRKVKMTHWVAGGSKDGKVSLWDVY